MRLGRDNTEDARVVHDLDVLSEHYGGDGAAAPESPPPPAEVRGRRTRLRRDNTEDPRVLHDLAVLGRTYGADEAALAEVAASPAVAAPPVAPDPGPMADPFVRRFVGASVHVKRYAGLYAGTLAWVVVMLLAAPRHHDAVPAQQAAFAGTPAVARAVAPTSSGATAAGAADVAPSSLAAPSGYDFGSTDATSLDDTTDATFASSTASESSSSSSTSSTSESFSTTDDASGSSDGAAPTKLTIVRSGYASNTAGTPVEQAPANGGLPVAAAGGQASKRSFIALGGGGTVLHLAVATDPGANVGDDRASISACPILKSGWDATRGQAMPGPEFTQPCAAGVRQSDGSWTFDLSAFGDPTKEAGFALTPDPSDAAATFQVTFLPKAL